MLEARCARLQQLIGAVSPALTDLWSDAPAFPLNSALGIINKCNNSKKKINKKSKSLFEIILNGVVELPKYFVIPILFITLSIVIGLFMFFAYGIGHDFGDKPKIWIKIPILFILIGSYLTSVILTVLTDRKLEIYGIIRLLLCFLISCAFGLLLKMQIEIVIFMGIIGGIIGFWGEKWIEYMP